MIVFVTPPYDAAAITSIVILELLIQKLLLLMNL